MSSYSLTTKRRKGIKGKINSAAGGARLGVSLLDIWSTSFTSLLNTGNCTQYEAR